VLASLIASAKNLLVLDEPTNHLDIPSAERLEEALDKFGAIDKSRIGGKGGHGGVLLLISHDRALLDDVCDTLVILDGAGNARVFDGSYRDWEAKEKAEKSERAAAADKSKKPDVKKPAQPAKPQPKPGTTGASGAPSKAPSGKTRFSNLPVEKIESRIADIGRELLQIDASFADPKVAADAARMKKLVARREELQKEQSELEDEWLRRSG
jgi:ATPase subunit of ABC transporter with duplicated ATPase domains